jgi:hypothetical protein
MTPIGGPSKIGTRAMPALPVRLDTLGPDDTRKHMAQLAAWIDWLTTRYQLDHRTIPPCWAHHGELVEELSALRTAWLSSYALTSPGGAPLAWHEAFAHCRTRLHDSAARNGCSRDGCRATPRSGVVPVAPLVQRPGATR